MSLRTIRDRFWSALCLAVIAAAVVLRFVNLAWMEFKGDEFLAYMFAVRTIKSPGTVLTGLRTSVGVQNPPFFIYLLALPVFLFNNPIAVTACIALLNVFALYLLYVLLRKASSIESALTITAIFASAPWPVFFSRKIWAQDVLFPFLIVCWLLLDENRLRRPAWMIVFALSLAAATQLHMSAWLLPIPLLLWMLLFRVRVPGKQVLLGGAVFFVLYIPYVDYLLRGGLDSLITAIGKQEGGPSELVKNLAWSICATTGLGFEYPLGVEGLAALQSWFGVTWALGVFSGYAAVAGCGLLFGAWRTVSTIQAILQKKDVQPLDRLLTLLMLIYVCIQASYFLLHVTAFPHYQIIFYPTVVVCAVCFVEWLVQKSPVPALWLSRALFTILMAANLWFTASAVTFIRTSPQLITGDYGAPYAVHRAEWEKAIEDSAAQFK